MKKQILSLGAKLTKGQQQSILGGGDPDDPIGNPGGGGPGDPGSGGTGNCGNYATCTNDGDCYNVINGYPSACIAGCCITQS